MSKLICFFIVKNVKKFFFILVFISFFSFVYFFFDNLNHYSKDDFSFVLVLIKTILISFIEYFAVFWFSSILLFFIHNYAEKKLNNWFLRLSFESLLLF